MVDPGEWLPLAGLLFIAGTTAISIAGAWAIGRARGMRDASHLQRDELDTHARIERMERHVEAIAEEMERLGEVQRFALKMIADRVNEASPESALLPQGRVITPH